jgi:hypothetical protein
MIRHIRKRWLSSEVQRRNCHGSGFKPAPSGARFDGCRSNTAVGRRSSSARKHIPGANRNRRCNASISTEIPKLWRSTRSCSDDHSSCGRPNIFVPYACEGPQQTVSNCNKGLRAAISNSGNSTQSTYAAVVSKCLARIHQLFSMLVVLRPICRFGRTFLTIVRDNTFCLATGACRTRSTRFNRPLKDQPIFTGQRQTIIGSFLCPKM